MSQDKNVVEAVCEYVTIWAEDYFEPYESVLNRAFEYIKKHQIYPEVIHSHHDEYSGWAICFTARYSLDHKYDDLISAAKEKQNG